MLSPAIKINKESKNGLIQASIVNLDYSKQYKVEFYNINLDPIFVVLTDSDLNINSIAGISEFSFSYKMIVDDDSFIFCKIFQWELDLWKEAHIATAVASSVQQQSQRSENIQVEQMYLGPEDRLSIAIKGSSDYRYDVLISDRTFGIKTNSNGDYKLSLSMINAIDYKSFASKFVKRYICRLIDPSSGLVIGSSEFDFVPERLYALAATNDPDRPGCVIMDPNPMAAFSVATQPLTSNCFLEPLVGKTFKSDGGPSFDSTRMTTYKNCNDGYIGKSIEIVKSDCKIYGQPKFAKLYPPISKEADRRIKAIFSSSGSDTPTVGEIGFVYSACDPAAELDVEIDPCSFVSKEIKKIPRIFLGSTSNSVGVEVISVARGIIKAPPKYFHTIIVDIDNIEDGDVVNVVFNLSSGDSISKSLVYDTLIHPSKAIFIDAFAYVMSSDENIRSSEITILSYPTSGRIDAYSNVKFNIFAGQVNSIGSNGEYLLNKNIKIIRDSKYKFDFEITKPSTYGDILYIFQKGPDHILFLDGKFKGMVIPIGNTTPSGKITLDTCPRVTNDRKSIGSFIIEKDEPCTHIAFLKIGSLPVEASSKTGLPFVLNKFNEVVPSSNPVITSHGDIFCQAFVDNKWQIFSYFPFLQDVKWVQLTRTGENRNPSASSDEFGNVHLAWETDRFGYTSVQYACIGPSSKLLNRLAFSGLITKQLSGEIYSNLFKINPTENKTNFIQNDSINIKLLQEKDIISLVDGAAIGGGEFYILREFTGYIKIGKEKLDELLTESASTKKILATWPEGAPPQVTEKTYCTSYIVHFQQESNLTSTIVQSYFHAMFSGKILRLFISPTDFSISSKYLSSSKIRYPSGGNVVFDNNPLVTSGTAIVDQLGKSIDFNFYREDTSEMGPVTFRILVEGTKDQSSVDQSEWNRVYSNNGKVSISSESSVSIECSPKNDCAIATLSVCKDNSGYFFQGQEAEIKISVHANCSINPSSSEKIIPTGSNLWSLEGASFKALSERDSPYNTTWEDGNITTYKVYFISEFNGLSGFAQPRQHSSKYRDGLNAPIVFFEDSRHRYFPGFLGNENIQSFLISINAGEIQNTIQKTFTFLNPILSLYIGRDDLEDTDVTLGNGVVNRENLVQDQGVSISINKSRTSLTLSLSPGYVDFSIRVVVSSDSFNNPYKLKDKKQIDYLYEDFIDSFTKQDDYYSLDNNLFTIGFTDKRYDTIIPLVGLLKFDDININPNANAGYLYNTSSIEVSNLSIDVDSIADVSSNDTYELNGKFLIDGIDAHLHNAYVCIVPERVSFIARNSETLNEYSARNAGQFGYREAVIKDVYTGYAKIFNIASGVLSSSKRTSLSLGTVEKYSDLASVDISSFFNIQIDFSYMRLSNEDKKLLSNMSSVSEDSFSASSKYYPNYHFICSVFVNDYPVISQNLQVDLGDKSRQWDVGFGSPFGLYPSCKVGDSSFLDLISSKNLQIDFSNIRIGNPRVSINPEIMDSSSLAYSNDSIYKLAPNSESNIENNSFESSLIDPGDWICLEDGSLLISEWEAVSGGCIYVGSYSSLLSGKRSVLLEGCIVDASDVETPAEKYRSFTQFKIRRGRISTGSYGGLSQDMGTLFPNEPHQIMLTTAVRQIEENFPILPKILMVEAEASSSQNTYASTVRHSPGFGEFINSDSVLNFKTFRLEFTPVDSELSLSVLSVSDSLNSIFSLFQKSSTDKDDEELLYEFSPYKLGEFRKSEMFYIDNLGALKCFGRIIPDQSITILSEPLKVIAIDSNLNYDATPSVDNAFVICVTSIGTIKLESIDGTESGVPSFCHSENLPEEDGFINISIGYNHGCAIKRDGTVVCWGDNTYGQSNTPLGVKFIQVKAGQYFTVGLKEDGNILCWGDDSNNIVTDTPSLGRFKKIDAGSEHAVAISTDGYVTSWGRNEYITDPVTVKMIDVAACGGNIFSLEDSPSATISNYNIKPFNVGIDVDGNVITWGSYSEAFTPETPASYDGLFNDIPEVKCVAVRKGLKSCALLGIDGRLYCYGLSYIKSHADNLQSGGVDIISSAYRTEFDFVSGGLFVDSLFVYPNSTLVEEDSDIFAHRLAGMESRELFLIAYGLPFNNPFISVPLVWATGVLQKSPICIVDSFNKCSIIWEDNTSGIWGICESSNIWLDRSFSDQVFLSHKDETSINSQFSIDGSGRRVVVWETVHNENHSIKIAFNSSHPDYVSGCDIDRIVSNTRIIGQDTDPYDPYNLEESLMSCRVDMKFIAPSSGTYFFSILFTDIEDPNIVYKTASSSQDSGNWLINNQSLSYDGQVLYLGEVVNISFTPSSTDSVFNKVLNVELKYSTLSTNEEEMFFIKKQHILHGTDWATADTSPIKYIKLLPFEDYPANDYLIFTEKKCNSPISILPQSISYFNSQGVDPGVNFIFPAGVSSLPGVEVGAYVRSFLVVLGDPGDNPSGMLSASLEFDSPILAILVDEVGLKQSDSSFYNEESPVVVIRKNVTDTFQFNNGEYMRLDENRKTLHIKFANPKMSTWPTTYKSKEPPSQQIISLPTIPEEVQGIGVNQDSVFALSSPDDRPYATFRVIIGNSDTSQGSIKGTYFCPFPLKTFCNLNASYKNNSTNLEYVHFKISVYSDSEYKDSLMTFDSKTNPRMWTSGHDVFPISGLSADPNSLVSSNFTPSIINVSGNKFAMDEESILNKSASGSTGTYYDLIRTSLLCGVKYYVIVEAVLLDYDVELYRRSFICTCDENLSDREDNFEWNSPRNDSTNTVIASSSGYIGHPSISGTNGGLFAISWEDSRNNVGSNIFTGDSQKSIDIYCGFFDILSSRIDSSYHGGVDRLMLNNSSSVDVLIRDQRMPYLISDIFSNFTLFCNIDYNIIHKRYLSVGVKIVPNIIDEAAVTVACSFTITDITRYKTAFEGGEFLQIKVNKKYIKGLKSTSDSIAMPIVSDCFVDLDIIGVPGAIAFRIKNESEIDFTEWIPINTNIQPIDSFGSVASDDIKNFRATFKGKWVANDIFTAPWVLSSGDGIKSVCIEVLTQFGKTKQFCIDIIAEYQSVAYVIDIFYSIVVGDGEDESSVLVKPVRSNGLPVVNKKTFYKAASDESPMISITKEDVRSLEIDNDDSTEVSVYVQVRFEDPERIARVDLLNKIESYSSRRVNSNFFMASIYQQGIRVESIELKVKDKALGLYFAEFKVRKSNGVLDRDGLAFVLIDLPSDCLNPFVKNFNNILRLILDNSLDSSSALVVDNNNFIEQYLNSDNRNAFGSRSYQ